MRILGIETSCDETAAAVVARNDKGEPEILSNIILSQIDEHAQFGGVVPEIAARAHLSALDKIIATALDEAGCGFNEIDGIGVTAGPGLIGGLMVGLMSAKAVSAAKDIPYLGINHLEGHALTARLTDNIPYPYLLLLVSGGHSQIICVRGLGVYERWATTIDDAVGEAFDKTAKLLGLPFPGGPNVEKTAATGNQNAFAFPKPLQGQKTLNMSFSGLKTAIRVEAERHVPLTQGMIADLCASMQKTVADILVDRCDKAIERFKEELPDDVPNTLVVAGGVASNTLVRTKMSDLCETKEWRLVAPPLELCTDNAAMIGWAALERFERGESSAYDFSPRSRWPLDEDGAGILGSGKKGIKV